MDKLRITLFVEYTKCSLNCPYCYVQDKHKDLDDKAVRKLNRAKDVIASLSYKTSIFIEQNGEVLISEKMKQFVIDLSWCKNVEAVNFNTSLYPSKKTLAEFLSRVNTKTLTLTCSYHQRVYSNYQNFRDKLGMLTSAGVAAAVLMVAWPEDLHKLKEYKKDFCELGTPLNINAFSGMYNGKRYPMAYTPAEKEFLREIFYSADAFEYNLIRKRTRGMACTAGISSVSITPKGDVFTCRQDWMKKNEGFLKSFFGWLKRKTHRFNPFYHGVHLGNLFSGFRLLKAHNCPHKTCKCARDFISTVDFLSKYKITKHLRIYRKKGS